MSVLANIVQKSPLEQTLERTEAVVVDNPRPSEMVIKTTTTQPLDSYPQGLKVFINVTLADEIPEPETWDTAEVARAVNGNPESKFSIPLSLSEPRADKDKSGSLCLVFDCCVNTKVFTQLMPPVATLQTSSGDSSRDDFKLYLTELCIEFVEEKHGFLLSRKFSYPRMLCKGKPAAHTFFRTRINPEMDVEVDVDSGTNKSGAKVLIEDVSPAKDDEEDDEEVPIPTIDLDAEPEIHEPTVSTEESVHVHEPYVGLKRPKFEYKEERHRHLLEVEMPDVSSAAEIIVDVCTSHILISVPGKYHLMSRVRNTVILDYVNADFDDTQRKLALKLPTKRTQMPNEDLM